MNTIEQFDDELELFTLEQLRSDVKESRYDEDLSDHEIEMYAISVLLDDFNYMRLNSSEEEIENLFDQVVKQLPSLRYKIPYFLFKHVSFPYVKDQSNNIYENSEKVWKMLPDDPACRERMPRGYRCLSKDIYYALCRRLSYRQKKPLLYDVRLLRALKEGRITWSELNDVDKILYIDIQYPFSLEDKPRSRFALDKAGVPREIIPEVLSVYGKVAEFPLMAEETQIRSAPISRYVFERS